MAIPSLSEIDFLITLVGIGGMIYHVGKKEGEFNDKIDRECDKIDSKVTSLRMDYVKLTTEVQQIPKMIGTREEILRNDLKLAREQDRKDFSIGQENDDRRIKKCTATVAQIENQLRDKQIYLKLDRNTHF